MAPREVALRILDGLFGPCFSPAARGGIELEACSLVDFQAEGVARVRAILDRRGGAILADSVGLGKTFMAVALIEETLRASGDAVVVVPAATRRFWRRALNRLPDAGGGWRLLSHTQLARGAPVRAASHTRAGYRLVVVDEAHRFRNPGTLRYAALARLLAPGTRVLFLTATPVNNRADDLLHLVRMFADDDAFRDVGVPSLRDAFLARSELGVAKRAGGEDSARHGESARIAAVVRATVVRRTRAMVRARFGGSVGEAGARGAGAADRTEPRFPRRASPQRVRYVDRALPRLVEQLADLELTPYTLRSPDSNGAAGSAALIRIGLLKRLDSSPAAFQASLHRLAQILRATLDAARAGRVLAGPGRWGQGPADGDPLQLSLIELVARPAPPDLDLDRLARSVERDLALVRRMGRLRGLPDRHHLDAPEPGPLAVDAVAFDSKLLGLHGLLTTIADEKTLVFTEYRDTADALWRGLRDRYPVGRVDGSGAWLGRRRAGRRAVVERFAPVANGRRPPPDRERVDVLIATDVLAEGLNLQDARHVVSYELPWNPVRLLQRIGRVDRLGSPHAEVVPYLFVPQDGLEAMLGLTRRVRAKLGHIAATVGAEQADELLERLDEAGRAGKPVRGAAKGPEDSEYPEDPEDPGALATALERAESEPTDPLEGLRTLWIRHRPNRRSRGGPGGRVVAGAAIAVPRGDEGAGISWVALVECRGAPILLEIDRDGNVAEAGQAALAVLALALDGAAGADLRSPVPLGPIKEHLAEATAHAHSPPRLSRHDPGLRLMRRLRRNMARAGAGLDPRVVARADALFDRMAVPLDPVSEVRVRSFLDRRDETSITALLDAAETALARKGGCETHVPPDGPKPTVIAALQIRLSDAPPRG